MHYFNKIDRENTDWIKLNCFFALIQTLIYGQYSASFNKQFKTVEVVYISVRIVFDI